VTAKRELRLALGLRGGVSLSVWIGGACAEVDELRTSVGSQEDVAPPFWKLLLDLTGHDAVAVDILAGASAGGLNAVIYAAAQIYGFPVGKLRDIWRKVGQIDAMVRPPGTDTPSLLLGDGFMLKQLEGELQRLAAEAATEGAEPALEARPRMDLFLTATLVEPVRRALPGEPNEPLFSDRFAAGFHFLNTGVSPWLSDFAADETEKRNTLSRLALAGRATSSFPFAFEPAAVWSSRPRSFSDEGRSPSSGDRVDMRDIFTEAYGHVSPQSADGDAFVVSDGGVLDNIPLGRALDAITTAPADRLTRRFLVYVQPGAPIGLEAARQKEEERAATRNALLVRRRSATAVVTGAIRTRVVSETIAGDLDMLEAHNRRIERAGRLRELTLGTLGSRAELLKIGELFWPYYRCRRGDADAQRVRALLDDPFSVLGKDVFPEPPSGVSYLAPLAHWSRSDREDLDGHLGSAITENLPSAWTDGSGTGALHGGADALVRTTRLLLEWARFVEANAARPADAEIAGQCKARLYRVLLFAERVLDAHRRIGWVTLASSRAPDEVVSVDVWSRDAVNQLDVLFQVDDALADTVVTQLNTPGVVVVESGRQDGLSQFRAASLSRLDELREGQIPASPSGVDIRDRVTDDVLSAVAATIASIEVELVPVAHRDPGARLNTVLAGTVPPPGRDSFAALEVACLEEHEAGLPGSRPVTFSRMSAGGSTPIGRSFRALLDDEPATNWMDNAVLAEPVVIPVDRKLAGNELKNFSAFLDERWRRNDWMWGHLDAVPTLVEMLVTSQTMVDAAREEVASRPVDSAADALLDRLHTIVVGSPDQAADDPASSWPAFREAALWQPKREAIAAEVRALAATAFANDEAAPSVAAIQTALAARRQWEVIADEMGDEPLSPQEAVQRAAQWAVGLETLKDLPPGYVAALGRRMFSVGRDAVEWNAAVTPVGPRVRYATRPAARIGTLGMRGLFGGLADRILIVGALVATLVGTVCTIVAGAFTRLGLVALVVALVGVLLLVWLSRPFRRA
jgi:patatin-related protein